jgi:hypothetical protein
VFTRGERLATAGHVEAAAAGIAQTVIGVHDVAHGRQRAGGRPCRRKSQLAVDEAMPWTSTIAGVDDVAVGVVYRLP